MSCVRDISVNVWSRRSALLAGVLFQIAVLLLILASESWAEMGPVELTELGLEELMNVRIAPAPAASRGSRARTIAAIRAGCSDGADICDALRAILKSSSERGVVGSSAGSIVDSGGVQRANFRASVDSVEYNVPHRDPAMYATQSDTSFIRAPSVVVGAMHALGLSSPERDRLVDDP